jgi:hypothetical protein
MRPRFVRVRPAMTKRVPNAKRGRPPGSGGWNWARMEALRRYYEQVCYGAKWRGDSDQARAILEEWRTYGKRRKGRSFSSVWAIRARLPKLRELIKRHEMFEKTCGMMGLLDQADIDAADSWEIPDDIDFDHEPDEY